MKNLGLLLSFAPLVVYGILSGVPVVSVPVALAAAVITTVIVSYRDLRKGMILPWTNLCLFGAALLAIGLLGMDGIVPWMGILIYAALCLVTVGSILAGRPFTLEYARTMVGPEVFNHPLFYRANLLITGVWGVVFGTALVLDGVALVVSGLYGSLLQGLTYVLLAAGIVFTVRFPDRMRARYTPSPGDSPKRS